MAAISAVSATSSAGGAGRRVVLLERTPDGGRKILVSGGGRCNVLPAAAAPERFVTDSSPHTLKKVLLSWPLAEQRRFFEREAGVPLVEEPGTDPADPRTAKLFPASGRARDVRDALFALAARRGVERRFGADVLDLLPPRDPSGSWTVVLAGGGALAAAAVVLATGGLSLPGTGSDGRGIEIARRLGHAVVPTYPALTPLTARPSPHLALAGISLPVALAAPGAPRPNESRGGFLFTHRGWSGPAILDLSHQAVRSRLAGGPRQPILVRWTERDEAAWEEALRTARGRIGALLARHLPDRLAAFLLAEAGVPSDRAAPQLRREERKALAAALARYPLPWTGDEGYAKAEVTGGGVALSAVEPRTLASRRHPGLFLCGELLDAFGPIGGHNFAWAWATGRLAGLGAGQIYPT